VLLDDVILHLDLSQLGAADKTISQKNLFLFHNHLPHSHPRIRAVASIAQLTGMVKGPAVGLKLFNNDAILW
jgi:hypothetical protein